MASAGDDIIGLIGWWGIKWSQRPLGCRLQWLTAVYQARLCTKEGPTLNLREFWILHPAVQLRERERERESQREREREGAERERGERGRERERGERERRERREIPKDRPTLML